MYSKMAQEHFGNPRNVGRPERFDVKGTAGNPEAGPFMIMYLGADEGVIQSAHFETYGCGAAMATGSMLTELIKGLTTKSAARIDSATLLATLGGLPLGKRHCADLATTALARALREIEDQE